MRQMMQRRYDLDWECDILSVHEFRRFRNVALYVSLTITLYKTYYLFRPTRPGPEQKFSKLIWLHRNVIFMLLIMVPITMILNSSSFVICLKNSLIVVPEL